MLVFLGNLQSKDLELAAVHDYGAISNNWRSYIEHSIMALHFHWLYGKYHHRH